MDCKQIANLLSEYIDGELGVEERQLVESHVSDCPGCRSQLNALQKAVSMLHSLGELEVPPEVSHALRRISSDSKVMPLPEKRWTAIFKLPYLAAASAAAVIALVITFSQTNMGNLDRSANVENAATSQKGIGEKNALMKDKAYNIDANKKSPNRLSAGGANGARELVESESSAMESYSRAKKDGATFGAAQAENDELQTQSMHAPSELQPEVAVTEKNYNADSAEKLLNDIKTTTDGTYTVRDAKEKRGIAMDALVAKVNERGGKGELLREPIEKILDQTERSALPVYLEKARFENQDCWLLVIRWGFGDDKNDLYKASLYVTDPSGWNTIHYMSN